MEKFRRYEFEGITIEIPLRYDELSKMYLEEYPDFSVNPVYTPEGCPVLFSGEDACIWAEAAEGEGCPDCGSCRFFRPAGSHTLMGVCGNEHRRHKPKQRATNNGGERKEKEEEAKG